MTVSRRHKTKFRRPLIVLLLILLMITWWYRPWGSIDRWGSGAPKMWSFRHLQEQLVAAKSPDGTVRSRYSYVPLSAVAIDMQVAALVGEDFAFFDHGPVDVEALWEAVDDWRDGKRLRGASTITQQLAKNLFLSPDRTWWRKIDELRLAYWLERHYSKRRILELYLNVIELGPGIYGVEAAAQYYFGTSAAHLSADQAAALAATIPSPKKQNPRTGVRRYHYRRQVIAARMRVAEHLRSYVRRLRAASRAS